MAKTVNNHDYIEEIEFFTIYPNREGSNTLLATFTSLGGYRGLLYAPNVSKLDLGLEQENNYEEIRDARHVPILQICTQRGLKINGYSYAGVDKHNEKGRWFFKAIYLDGPMSKPSVSIEDIEKLFGCVVHG